jgi:pimeloyl-ACP methyl ester carboxylesterase
VSDPGRHPASTDAIALPPLRTVEADGPIALREWDGPDDVLFVLLHGLGASHLSWIQVAEPLAGLGRVVAPDLPGFGGTPLAGRSTGLMDQRRSVSALLAGLGGGSVVLVGNSLGGAIALLQAAVEPSTVAGIVLTNSVYPWHGATIPHPLIVLSFGLYRAPVLGDRYVAWRLRALEPEQLVRLSLRFLAADPRSIPEDVVALLVELTAARKDDPDVPRAFLGAARSMLRLGARPKVARRALDNVTCPVLVLHGRRDRFVPAAFAEAELARHPGWRGRFFDDLGHIPQMEAPGRWLSEVADWSSSTFG